jgi:CRP/FNR family cyclic AMP-dependent transcriptional regulator
MDRSETESILEGCEFFKGLEKNDIKKIAALCQEENYEAGEYVFRQGDFGEHLYIISQGRVFLERSADLGTRKGSVVIGILGKGRVFGCWSTLLDEPHTLMSSAASEKDTRVLVMKGSDLRDMMVQNIEFGFSILERLCFLLRNRIQDAYGALEKI